MVRSSLHYARKAIDQALEALNGVGDWPREQDYE
jgi:hypothetical protein